jgi:hypothetical protein
MHGFHFAGADLKKGVFVPWRIEVWRLNGCHDFWWLVGGCWLIVRHCLALRNSSGILKLHGIWSASLVNRGKLAKA